MGVVRGKSREARSVMLMVRKLLARGRSLFFRGRRVTHLRVLSIAARLKGSSPDPEITHTVERFTCFHGVLHFSGWAETTVPVTRVFLRFGEGTQSWRTGHRGIRLPVRLVSDSGNRQRIRIDLRRSVGLTAAEVSEAHLELRFIGGGRRILRRLGAPVQDSAHNLTIGFAERLRVKPTGHLLEIGSRSRSGNVNRYLVPEGWTYEGLDVVAGPNVDTVGDAHRLASLYPPATFDAVLAVSVLEHILMPWRFVVELNRVLKPGALGFFVTHQTWPLHDQPFDYFRFSDRAWIGLLNEATGFEILAAKMGEPCFVVPSKVQSSTAFGEETPAGMLISSVLFRKIGETELSWNVDPEPLMEGTYPLGDG